MNELRNKRLEEERRAEIFAEKSEKQADLQRRFEGIQKARAAAGSANSDARARRKAADAEREAQLQAEREANNAAVCSKNTHTLILIRFNTLIAQCYIFVCSPLCEALVAKGAVVSCVLTACQQICPKGCSIQCLRVVC
jgi:hypothetical protein